MNIVQFALALAVPCLVPSLHAKPGILWELPATLKRNPDHPTASQQAAVQWLNDEEIVAVRRGGVAGGYHCGKKSVVWEKKFEHLVRGCAITPDALYLAIETPENLGTLSRFAISDGMLKANYTSVEFEGASRAAMFRVNQLAWLPKTKVLAVEAQFLDVGAISDAWFFDPASKSIKGDVPVEGTVSTWGEGFTVDNDKLFWVAAGVIRGAGLGDLKPRTIWDTGLGYGIEDGPSLRGYRAFANGSFLAILDDGGWEGGRRIFRRGKPDEEVVMTYIDRSIGQFTVSPDLKLIYATLSDDRFGILDAQGHLLKSIAHVVGGDIAISPSGKRAAVLGFFGKLTFLALQ